MLKFFLPLLFPFYIIPAWKIIDLWFKNVLEPGERQISGSGSLCDEKGCLNNVTCIINGGRRGVRIKCGEGVFSRYYYFERENLFSSPISRPVSFSDCVKIFGYSYMKLFYPESKSEIEDFVLFLGIDLDQRRVRRWGDEIAYAIGDEHLQIWFHQDYYVPLRVFVINKINRFECEVLFGDYMKVKEGYHPLRFEVHSGSEKVFLLSIERERLLH